MYCDVTIPCKNHKNTYYRYTVSFKTIHSKNLAENNGNDKIFIQFDDNGSSNKLKIQGKKTSIKDQ
jgi:hypothetical protein